MYRDHWLERRSERFVIEFGKDLEKVGRKAHGCEVTVAMAFDRSVRFFALVNNRPFESETILFAPEEVIDKHAVLELASNLDLDYEHNEVLKEVRRRLRKADLL